MRRFDLERQGYLLSNHHNRLLIDDNEYNSLISNYEGRSGGSLADAIAASKAKKRGGLRRVNFLVGKQGHGTNYNPRPPTSKPPKQPKPTPSPNTTQPPTPNTTNTTNTTQPPTPTPTPTPHPTLPPKHPQSQSIPPDKSWWDKYKNYVVSGVAVAGTVAGLYGGYRVRQAYQQAAPQGVRRPPPAVIRAHNRPRGDESKRIIRPIAERPPPSIDGYLSLQDTRESAQIKKRKYSSRIQEKPAEAMEVIRRQHGWEDVPSTEQKYTFRREEQKYPDDPAVLFVPVTPVAPPVPRELIETKGPPRTYTSAFKEYISSLRRNPIVPQDLQKQIPKLRQRIKAEPPRSQKKNQAPRTLQGLGEMVGPLRERTTRSGAELYQKTLRSGRAIRQTVFPEEKVPDVQQVAREIVGEAPEQRPRRILDVGGVQRREPTLEEIRAVEDEQNRQLLERMGIRGGVPTARPVIRGPPEELSSRLLRAMKTKELPPIELQRAREQDIEDVGDSFERMSIMRGSGFYHNTRNGYEKSRMMFHSFNR